MPFDDLLLEHPQQRIADASVLRKNIGSLRINWAKLVDTYKGNEMKAVGVVCGYVKDKMNSALNEFYGEGRGDY